MTQDKRQSSFWKEHRKIVQEDESTWLITKDDQGKCIFDPEENRSNVANYYESLYKAPPMPPHEYHQHVTDSIKRFEKNRDYEEDPVNTPPSIDEVRKVINKRKDGKATTDINNEMIKRGGEPMTKMIYDFVAHFWNNEKVATQWNEGLITSLWKKKGDREVKHNQRGITVSSTVSMIIEEILDERIRTKVSFTQAQGGGQKGCSKCDHLFCPRVIIAMAIKEGKKMFLTLFDVKKAYDHQPYVI